MAYQQIPKPEEQTFKLTYYKVDRSTQSGADGSIDRVLIAFENDGKRSYALDFMPASKPVPSLTLKDQCSLPNSNFGDIEDFDFEEARKLIESVDVIRLYGSLSDEGNGYCRYSLYRDFTQREIVDVVVELCRSLIANPKSFI